MADNRITIQAEFGQSYKDLGFIGRVGENDSREIVFDCADTLTQFPGASIVCVIKRACDTKPYSAALMENKSSRILPLSAVENAVAGQIMIELRAVSNDTILKSAMFSGRISESLQGEGDRPGNPVRDVLDRVDSVLEEAKAARDKLDALIDTIQGKLDNGDFVGAPGKDAQVTADSVTAALGYVPIKEVQVGGESVTANGVASVPIASETKAGTIKVGNARNSGLFIDADGNAYVSFATNGEINIRDGTRKTITCSNLDYAVKAAMCDGKGAAWTAAEQQAARDRMGIGRNYELIEEIEVSEDGVSRVERELDIISIYLLITAESGHTGTASIILTLDTGASLYDAWCASAEAIMKGLHDNGLD